MKRSSNENAGKDASKDGRKRKEDETDGHYAPNPYQDTPNEDVGKPHNKEEEHDGRGEADDKRKEEGKRISYNLIHD